MKTNPIPPPITKSMDELVDYLQFRYAIYHYRFDNFEDQNIVGLNKQMLLDGIIELQDLYTFLIEETNESPKENG